MVPESSQRDENDGLPGRRWRIPPPVLTGPEEPGPQGLMILEEVPGALGLLLWRQLRATLLWIRCEPDKRSVVFPEDLARRRRSEVREILDATELSGRKELGLLRSGLETILGCIEQPTGADPCEIARGCGHIADWAGNRGAAATALEFRQGAALATPADPDRAYLVFLSARDLAQFSRAEAWFHRVVGLSRRAGAWTTYIRAYQAHGTLLVRRDLRSSARRSFLKALRRARRQGLRTETGITLQRLVVLEYRDGRPDIADELAHEALERLEPDRARARGLGYDLAFAWLDAEDYEPASIILRSLAGQMVVPGRTGFTGALARARAGAGDVKEFEAARSRLERLPDDEELSSAWLNVARGALLLGRLDEVESAVGVAVGVARHRWTGAIRFGAAAILQAARHGLPPGFRAAPDPPARLSPERTRKRVELARAVVEAMREDDPVLS